MQHDSGRPHVARPVKETSEKHLTGKSYPTHHIHQTLLHQTTICSCRCSLPFLHSDSIHMKNDWIHGLLQNLRSSMRESIICTKMVKRCSFRWPILWIKYNVPLLSNKCDFLTKISLKLNYRPNILFSALTSKFNFFGYGAPYVLF